MQREGRGGKRRLHERLAYVVRVDNRSGVAHVAVTPAVRSGRVVHRCIRSACRSHLCVGLCIVVVAHAVAGTFHFYAGEGGRRVDVERPGAWS